MSFIFKTPLPQLVDFFQESRDKWKAKTITAKEQIKLLKKQVNYHVERNSTLKEEVKYLKQENQMLKKTTN